MTAALSSLPTPPHYPHQGTQRQILWAPRTHSTHTVKFGSVSGTLNYNYQRGQHILFSLLSHFIVCNWHWDGTWNRKYFHMLQVRHSVSWLPYITFSWTKTGCDKGSSNYHLNIRNYCPHKMTTKFIRLTTLSLFLQAKCWYFSSERPIPSRLLKYKGRVSSLPTHSNKYDE